MERPVHPWPCEACRTDTGPDADHHRRWNRILSRLDGPQRRWVAATEAGRLGPGGFNTVAAITGMHPETLRRGRDESDPGGRTARPAGSDAVS